MQNVVISDIAIFREADHILRGCAKKIFFQKSENTMEVGGWVGPGLIRNCFCWKIIPKYL